MKGMIVGLDLDTSEESMALLYLAIVQALAYNVRYMFESIAASGVTTPKVVVICGGLANNHLYVQTHADIVGIPFVKSRCPEPVLLGSAILASVAAGDYSTVDDACSGMRQSGDIIYPNNNVSLKSFHEKKYHVYRKLLTDQLEILSMMK